MGARIGLRPLAELCRRTGISHAAGLDARTIWKRETGSGSTFQRRQLQIVSESINQGSTLAEGMTATNGYFPPLVLDMVDIGEKTGKVDEVLTRLSQYYDRIASLRSLFLKGIAWPMLQLGITIFVVGFVIWILGTDLFRQGGEPVDILGFGLTGNRGLAIYSLVVGMGAAAIIWLVLQLQKGELATPIMGLLMRIPKFGYWLQLMAVSRLAWSLGLAIESGMDAKKSIAMALQSTQNRYFTQHSPAIQQRVRRGDSLRDAFASADIFTQDFLDAVDVGEQTGRLAESLDVFSRQCDEKAQVAMQGVAVLGWVLVSCFVAGLIIFLIFRLALSYVGIINDLTKF